MPRRVIGIDPGFDRVGVAVLEEEKQKHVLLYSECITTSRKDAHAKRLLALGERLAEIIGEWRPNELAIEKLFFNQNTSSALKVAEARGVIMLRCAEAGLTIAEYFPQDIKIAVTGYGKADKVAIEDMVRKLIKFPAPDGKKSKVKTFDDEIDAVAVGITHLATRKAI